PHALELGDGVAALVGVLAVLRLVGVLGQGLAEREPEPRDHPPRRPRAVDRVRRGSVPRRPLQREHAGRRDGPAAMERQRRPSCARQRLLRRLGRLRLGCMVIRHAYRPSLLSSHRRSASSAASKRPAIVEDVVGELLLKARSFASYGRDDTTYGKDCPENRLLSTLTADLGTSPPEPRPTVPSLTTTATLAVIAAAAGRL